MKRFFITGGGTGGHIYPAIAVADALKADDIFYIGNPKNLEFDIVKQKGYKFLGVNVHGMPRSFGLDFIKWTFQLIFAVLKCCFYVLKYRPDAVFGTGGYVSAPALLAAKVMRVPYMMHDCDAQPGLVTRKIAPYASCVSLAFDCAKNYVNNKNCNINGNPIRAEFKTLSKEDARKILNLENRLTLCIMGGSQGARTINDASVDILKQLSKEYNMQIIFQTGRRNFEVVIEQLLKVYPEYETDKNLIIKPYFDDMVTVLKASDIAISRSGSLSISEICASGIAPIFVPYPYAAADHQRKNAKFMVEKGAGLYIEDSELTANKLMETVKYLVDDKNKLEAFQKNAFSLAKFDGTEKIVQQLKNICNICYNNNVVLKDRS